MIGTRLLHYDITAQLGEGGMGVVYRATDTRLNRDVAIKVLPEAFVEDVERLARFQREAQLLASLNHPNIGGIHGLEESGALRFLVLELIEGDTLSERLSRGPMRVEEVLVVALQIAQALEAAHAQGIIHRDLKPDNIKLTPEGQAKVLDFGLAKAWDQPTGASDLTHSPTLTAQMTQAGVILGTASYMSPEQARAQEADKRADIWSFGVVLYEMLTGGRIYSGDTVTDILGAIVHKEPDWGRLPPDLPQSIERLLRRCLEKDRQRRVQDIGDARIEIEEVIEQGDAAPVRATPARTPRAVRLAPWAIAAAAILLSVWTTMGPRPEVTVQPYARFSVGLAEGQRLQRENGQAVAISPDGSRIAFSGVDESGERLYLRLRGEGEVQPIAGTEGARQVTFSPDGRWIAFNQAGSVHKLSLEGGAPTRLVPQSARVGLAWAREGWLYYTPDWGSGLYRVSVDGGPSEIVTTLDADASEGVHLWPEPLPGGEAVLFSIWDTSTGDCHMGLSRLGKEGHSVLLRDALSPRYSPTGHLLFVRGDALMAVEFDLARLEIGGEPVAIQTGVRNYPAYLTAIYDVSEDGTLVFQAGGFSTSLREMVWVSPTGEARPAVDDHRAFVRPAISPDGRRVAVTLEQSLFEIWIYDLSSGTRAQLTRESDNGGPAWTSDGRDLVFWSARVAPYGIFRMAADGTGSTEMLYRSEGDTGFPTVSPDGRYVIFEESVGSRSTDLTLLDLEGEQDPRPFRGTEADEQNPTFSVDGRWVAYQSSESGRDEIYVAPFPGPGSSWLISSGGGTAPSWDPGGGRLYYRNGDQMLSVDIDTAQEFRAQRPRLLFELPRSLPEFAVAPDGRDFLMIRSLEQDSPEERQIEVALNWTERLGRDGRR